MGWASVQMDICTILSRGLPSIAVPNTLAMDPTDFCTISLRERHECEVLDTEDTTMDSARMATSMILLRNKFLKLNNLVL